MGTGPAADPALEHFSDVGIKPFGAEAQLGREMASEKGGISAALRTTRLRSSSGL